MLGNYIGLGWYNQTTLRVMFHVLLFRGENCNALLIRTVNRLTPTRPPSACSPLFSCISTVWFSIPVLQICGNVLQWVRDFFSTHFLGWIGYRCTVDCPLPHRPTTWSRPMPFSVVGIIFNRRSRGTLDAYVRSLRRKFRRWIKDKDACIAIVNPIAERCQMFVEQNDREKNGRRLDKLLLDRVVHNKFS
jgi:hypothetical protein